MAEERKFIEPFIFDNEKDRKEFGFGIDEKKQGLMRPMEFDVRTKSVEEKNYIILYVVDWDSNGDSQDEILTRIYSLCVGRTDAYNDIKNKLISGVPIDIHRSKVITETKQTETESGDRKYYLLPYEECISVYSFCTSVKDYYSFDPFDIEDYNDSEVPETSNEFENNPNYLTAEQLDYRKMLEASMHRDKMFRAMKDEGIGQNNNLI